MAVAAGSAQAGSVKPETGSAPGPGHQVAGDNSALIDIPEAQREILDIETFLKSLNAA